MPTRRARLRRRFLRLRIPLLMAEYPLEVGLCFWGLFAWVNIISGTPPSTSLQSLPTNLQTLWAALMIVATLTVAFGLFLWKAAIARGMNLFGSILVAFAVAVFGNAGWHKGGAVGGLMMIFGIVSIIRGWYLSEQGIALRKARYREIEQAEAEQAEGEV